MKTFIGLWCEYDYGQDSMIFNNEDEAEKWLWEQMVAIDGEEHLREYFGWEGPRSIFEEGLAGYRLISLWEPK